MTADDTEGVRPVHLQIGTSTGPVFEQINADQVTIQTGAAIGYPRTPRVLPRGRNLLLAVIVLLVPLVLAVIASLSDSRAATVWVVAGASLIASASVMLWVTSGSTTAVVVRTQGVRITARQLLIDAVDQLWIRDTLHRSLRDVIRLQVGLAEQPDAVAGPWGLGELADLRENAPLPAGTRLADLLRDRSNGRMLVLGEPGSGKTTHLLELGESLLQAARADDATPIPVILLLSTWSGDRSFQNWVGAEVERRYRISRNEVEQWLLGGELFLLLDGLDEVAVPQRAGCLGALAEFCGAPEFAATGLVVTSRTDEFRELGRQLPVDAGARVLPLTAEQVRRSLDTAGSRSVALRDTVRTDPVFAELMTTPLMLGVATLAFAGLPRGTGLAPATSEEYRELLYGLYVHRMLDRSRSFQSGTGRPFSAAGTYFHLVWLARLMSRQGQTIFYPDWLTPAWLPDRRCPWPLPERSGPTARLAARLGWDHTSTGLVGGRLGALAGALSAAPLGALAGGWPGALIAAACAALLVGGAIGVTFGVLFQSRLFERLFTPVVGSDSDNVFAASSWTWSWSRVGRTLIAWLLFGGFIAGVLWLAGTPLVADLAVAGIVGFGGVLSGGTVPDHRKPPASPGTALEASLRRLTYLLGVLVLVAFGAAALMAVTGSEWSAPLAALPATAAFMLTAGPARAWLRYRAAYFGARKSHLFPPDLPPLLTHAEDRVLLRRAGGGFMFLHRTLQQYLAERDPDDPPTVVAVGAPGATPASDS